MNEDIVAAVDGEVIEAEGTEPPGPTGGSGLVAQAAATSDETAVAGRASAARKRTVRAPRSETRIADEAAFVLHSHPYKETSLIVDVLTRHHGRVALVARGAKRPRSALRGVLLAFQPLSVAWLQGRARAVNGAQGGGDLRTLTRAEWLGGLMPLRGEALMSGFYLNELIQKLLARTTRTKGCSMPMSRRWRRSRPADPPRRSCGASRTRCCARPDMRCTRVTRSTAYRSIRRRRIAINRSAGRCRSMAASMRATTPSSPARR